MEKANDDIVVAIIIASVGAVVLAVFTLLFFLVFVRKKRILNKKKEELTRTYEKLILQTKLEIQEQTLTNISREIHDNIGQVLSFVKLSLGTAAKMKDGDKQEKINESVQLIGTVINDLRDLSKSLSLDRIKKEGLYQAIKDEVERLNRSGIICAHVDLNGKPFKFNVQTDMVLYRIFQEIVNNTLKHAESETLTIDLTYSLNLFTLTLEDKGKGFNTVELIKSKGQGLENIKQRAALIDAEVAVNSVMGSGCLTSITLKHIQENITSDE
jgi:signal transduction histidine kinase